VPISSKRNLLTVFPAVYYHFQAKKCLGIKSDKDLKGTSEKKELKESPYRIMASSLFNWFANYLNDNKSFDNIKLSNLWNKCKKFLDNKKR